MGEPGVGSGFAASEKSARIAGQRRIRKDRLEAIRKGQEIAPVLPTQISLSLFDTGRKLTVENQKFMLPDDYGTLAGSIVGVKYELLKTGDFQDLPQLAREMGFTNGEDVSTKKGHWRVYQRVNHAVANFADAPTIINSTLAIYDTGDKLTQVVLRTSLEANPHANVGVDLDIFTKSFIERPWIFGATPRVLTSFVPGILGSMAGGVLVGGVLGYDASSGQLISSHLPLLGELGAPAIYAASNLLLERMARRKLSDLKEYSIGRHARTLLHSERHHTVSVAIQSEVFDALKEGDPDLSPEQFLNKVYGQLPPELIQRRVKEVEEARYAQQFAVGEASNALPNLIGIARVLATT